MVSFSCLMLFWSFGGHACQWCQSEDHYITLGSWTDVSCVRSTFANAPVMSAPKSIGSIALTFW